jgi:hypothetical protein
LGEFPADGPHPLPKIGTDGWLLLRPGGGEWIHAKKGSPNGIRGVAKEYARREEGFRILLEVAPGVEIVCHSSEPIREGEEWIWIPAKGVWMEG